MKILGICLFIVLLNSFIVMFFARIRNRGTVGYHRRKDNIRRKRKEVVDVQEIITTGDILKMMDSNRL